MSHQQLRHQQVTRGALCERRVQRSVAVVISNVGVRTERQERQHGALVARLRAGVQRGSAVPVLCVYLVRVRVGVRVRVRVRVGLGLG